MPGEEVGSDHGAGGIGRVRSLFAVEGSPFEGGVAWGVGFVVAFLAFTAFEQLLLVSYGVAVYGGGPPGPVELFSNYLDYVQLDQHVLPVFAPLLGAAVAVRWPEDRRWLTRQVAVGATVATVVGFGSLYALGALVDPTDFFVLDSPLWYVLELVGRAAVIGGSIVLGGWVAAGVRSRTDGPERRQPGDWSDLAGRRSESPDDPGTTDPAAETPRRRYSDLISRFRSWGPAVLLGAGVLFAEIASGGIHYVVESVVYDAAHDPPPGITVEMPSFELVVQEGFALHFDPLVAAVVVGLVVGLVGRRWDWVRAAAGAGTAVAGLRGVLDSVTSQNDALIGSIPRLDTVLTYGLDVSIVVAVVGATVAYLVANVDVVGTVRHYFGEVTTSRRPGPGSSPGRTAPLGLSTVLATFVVLFVVGTATTTAWNAFHFGWAGSTSQSPTIEWTLLQAVEVDVWATALAPIAGAVYGLVSDRRWVRTGIVAAAVAVVAFVAFGAVEVAIGLVHPHVEVPPGVTRPLVYRLRTIAAEVGGVALLAGSSGALTSLLVRTRPRSADRTTTPPE